MTEVVRVGSAAACIFCTTSGEPVVLVYSESRGEGFPSAEHANTTSVFSANASCGNGSDDRATSLASSAMHQVCSVYWQEGKTILSVLFYIAQ